MTPEQLLEIVDTLALARNARTGRPYLHKPLLLLLVLGRLANTGSSEVRFADVADELGALIGRYSDPEARSNVRDRAAMPFVHLERTVWEVMWADGSPLGSDTPRRAARLTAGGAHGRLTGDALSALSGAFAAETVARAIVERFFPEDVREPVLADLSLARSGALPMSSVPSVGRLSELTDPQAVRAAIDEYRALGREAFLAKHDLEKSRDYFIRYEGELLDTKPVLSIAFGYQYPQRGPLDVSRFSGGAGGGAAVTTLRRLGFETVTRAQLHPPHLGEEHATRTAVQDRYGGDNVAGIIRFPGDEVVNVFSDADGPYADDPPTLAEPFGYRGEGLNGPQRLNQRGNALLEKARLSRSPIRFWYRPKGAPYSFMSWAVVVGRAWVTGKGQDGLARSEIEWSLEAVPSADPSSWPKTLKEAIEDAAVDLSSEPDAPEAQPDAPYVALVERVEQRGQRKRATGAVVVDYPRSAAARRAVLVRSGGACESPSCTGMPRDKNRRGEPILEVDHVRDLGLGGEDHPRNMVALCPNCHACKTYGEKAQQWQRELRKVARIAHEKAIARKGFEA